MAEVTFNQEEPQDVEAMLQEKAMRFDRPIPGQSLTNDPDTPLPYEQPATYTNRDDALQYFFALFVDEENYSNIMELIDTPFPIMDIVKKSAAYPNIKAFKPELGKNIRLESVQTEGSQFPTYYVVFVNQDGQAERLQNDLGLNIIYNPKEDYEAAKAQLPLELQNVNNFEEFKKMRVLELEGAVAIPKGLNPKSTHFFEDGSILYKGKLYKNSAELKAANKKK